MKTRTDFPYQVREIEHVWIPLSDGARLAARVWLPVDAEQAPVPAILEYIPYSKSYGTTFRDIRQHPYIAGYGYACVRVDLRGSGESDGILQDEYLQQEQDDALEVLRWIAEQPWCNGVTGMIGISWGGFSALQVAARRPPGLKGIITICSTDDRYGGDCHYMGGCVLGSDMLSWASHMLVINARPPDPRLVGERWRDIWFDRLEHTPPYIEAWLTHQTRDAFWKHGSVCEDYGAINCPVFAVGGWADPYRDTVFRLLEHLSVPTRALIGPWSHNYPESGAPGPAIGFLQECVEWWDSCLKGIDPQGPEEPPLRVWMQHSVEPRTEYDERPGHWVHEPEWPTANVSPLVYSLNEGRLMTGQAPPSHADVRGFQDNGSTAGVWCPGGGAGELPGPQNVDDGLSLTFASEPADQPVQILGFPSVTLDLASDRPNALVAVRLCDVAPDGASTLVSWGLLNLTHRDGHEAPRPLTPGARLTVTVPMISAAHELAVGHRWRLAISPTYWPHAWPSPEPVTLRVFTGDASRLELPLREPRSEDGQLKAYGEPEAAPALQAVTLRTPSRRRTVSHEVVSQAYQLIDSSDYGRRLIEDTGMEFDEVVTNTYTIVEGAPLSARVQCDRRVELARTDWRVRIETCSVMTADSSSFRVTNTVDAYERDCRVFTRSSSFSVPRHLV